MKSDLMEVYICNRGKVENFVRLIGSITVSLQKREHTHGKKGSVRRDDLLDNDVVVMSHSVTVYV